MWDKDTERGNFIAIWAIGDLHLSFGCPNKEMGVFGPDWKDHHEKIRAFWDANVAKEDLVLIPGDISWAMKLEDAMADLLWIEERPGCKVLIRGNHDYWWDTASKVRRRLPPSLHILSSDAFHWNDVSIAGARLWDTKEYHFGPYIDMKPSAKPKPERTELENAKKEEEDEKIFCRELLRLQASLNCLRPDAKFKIVMTHYPPISADLKDSTVSKMLENAHVNCCVFGHLHSVRQGQTLFGTKEGIEYHLTSCDWLNFTLLRLLAF